ncbi:TRAP transporter small permease [Ammoniphilus resinae]|uniref:TRAP-type C4-dicarboxylate transport system permease small subunit n=1 Tax=Ammoniphilus resinae TaxID=861532 RepID=A0ABS4GPV2_9BACL|nr:TRAP transporter small permease [Ammoniphilus resinae]MBP1932251.1 TRAP-type C4-dicarboxylate transport system permease small subunit [Ammoniphilus resinae]
MKRLVAGFERFLDYFIVTMTIGIVVCVALQVLFRYVFAYSAPWTEEIARFMFIYLTFVGSAVCMKEKTHITIEVLIEVLPKWLRSTTLILVQLLTMWFLVVVLIGSWQMVLSSTEVRSASLIWLNYSYVYFALFFGAVLMLIYSIFRLYELVQSIFQPVQKEQSLQSQNQTMDGGR